MKKTAKDLLLKESAKIASITNFNLEDLGFIPGENITIMAELTRQGPKAVRVGQSTFALSTAELEAIIIDDDVR